MGIWNRIFQRIDPADIPAPGHFGRFSDAYKKTEQYSRWDSAMQAFDDQNYRDTLHHFLLYLLNDEEDNIIVDDKSRNMDFSIIQGSKKITGQFLDDRLFAISHLVSGSSYSTGLLRRLLEKNYELNYCRYALNKEGQITIIFESFIKDANPYKLFFGLKELAIHADKMDDLILIEFEELKAQDAGHTRPVSEELATIKSDFYFSKLGILDNELKNGYLKRSRDPNSIIYSILSTFYKIDFLLAPHGKSTELIEGAHKSYFSEGTRSVELKVQALMNAVDKVMDIPTEDLHKEWYDVIYTFGINPPIDLYQAQSSIQTEIKKVDWYIENNEFDEAKAVTGFIIGYILFDYSVDHLLKSLLTMYYRVIDADYFTRLGYKSEFISKKGGLNKNKISAEFKRIIDVYEDEFHNVVIPLNRLNYTTTYHFGQSLLHLILNSKFIPIEESR